MTPETGDAGEGSEGEMRDSHALCVEITRGIHAEES